MIHCCTAKDFEEASLLILQLRANGIDAKGQERESAVAFGDLPAEVLRVSIYVPEAQLEAARPLIRSFYAQSVDLGTEHGKPWTCASCGEQNEPTFQVCWSCQAVAPGA